MLIAFRRKVRQSQYVFAEERKQPYCELCGVMQRDIAYIQKGQYAFENRERKYQSGCLCEVIMRPFRTYASRAILFGFVALTGLASMLFALFGVWAVAPLLTALSAVACVANWVQVK